MAKALCHQPAFYPQPKGRGFWGSSLLTPALRLGLLMKQLTQGLQP